MDFDTIVRIYRAQIRPKALIELDWFSKQPNLTDTIAFAALAQNSEGKRYSHQRRLKSIVLEQAKEILLSKETQISRTGCFDELFSVIEDAVGGIKGIGELYIYDTSLRIGAKLNLYPDKVYLHAGTRQGVNALGIDSNEKVKALSELPKELLQLEPFEVEDVLCIFKNEIKTGSVQTIDPVYKRRSWCY